MLTTVTTVGGLTPIMLEKSFQAQILIPMAASIAFGEIFATMLVLYLVPCSTRSTAPSLAPVRGPGTRRIRRHGSRRAPGF